MTASAFSPTIIENAFSISCGVDASTTSVFTPAFCAVAWTLCDIAP